MLGWLTRSRVVVLTQVGFGTLSWVLWWFSTSVVGSDSGGFLVVSESLPWRNLTRLFRSDSTPNGFGRQEVSGILTVGVVGWGVAQW